MSLEFTELNAAFTVIFLLMSITTLIKFEVTLLTRLASRCIAVVSLCVTVELQSELYQAVIFSDNVSWLDVSFATF